VPVRVILNPKVALVGAACRGLETYGESATFEGAPLEGDGR